MGGASLGGVGGGIAGFLGGSVLVLWDKGRRAGPSLPWLGVGALIMIVCLVWVALI
jgi:hypothetical protein